MSTAARLRPFRVSLLLIPLLFVLPAAHTATPASTAPTAPQTRKAPAAPATAQTAASAPTAAKRPLAHKDYDAWRAIATPTLSPDGRWLAYSYMPQDGDGDLVVRDLKAGTERREGVGALPPPPLPRPEETNPDEPPAVRGIRIAFTSDSRFVVASTYPPKADTDAAKKAKKKADEMPKGGLLVMDLGTGAVARADSVKSFQVPAKGGAWVAYLKEAAPEPKKEEKPCEPGATGEKPAAGGTTAAKPASSAGAGEKPAAAGALGRPGGQGGRARKDYGTDLVLRDLAEGGPGDRTFANVLEYGFARDGRTLVYTVSSRTEDDNGVFAVAPGTNAAPTSLLSGKGKYAKLTWDRAQKRLAFVSDRDDAASKAPRSKIYFWERSSPSAVELVSSQTPGFPADLAITDKGTLGFSRDGSRLYVAASRPPKPPKDEEDAAPADDRVVADLWNWQDDYVQPMQRIRANQERNRTWHGVFDLAAKRYVQVADATMDTILPSDDGSHAIGFDSRPYRRMVDFDGEFSDAYLVDIVTGARTPVAKKLAGGGFRGTVMRWSPDGRFAAFFKDGQWHAVDARDEVVRTLTAGLSVSFADENDDTPDPPGSYGSGGWTRDSAAFLAYDRYDVWKLFPDGRPAENVTEGEGRKARVVFRVQDIEPEDEETGERGIDPAKPLTLRAESEETRATGFYRESLAVAGPPRRLLWGDSNYRYAGRARGADVLLVTASRFDEFPDLHVTDASFKAPVKVSDGGSQTQPFLWGTGELVSFRNADGVPLRAALYKPANFDPAKKYPLIVYIYERLSQNVHNFVNPAPGHNVNFAYYVSNGYLILTPDIVYTLGQPGQSALKCVLPAVQAVVDKGFVDENAIGIQGHSWGGYQIAYMLTQTSRFSAAEAGAPVGNMTSAYSGIRWGSGLPRQFQYEQTQSRIGPSLYDAPLKYLENSAVFHVKRVTTPLLILHDDQDDAVPWYQGIELFLALRRNGKEAYLFNYNGEFHGLRRRHNQKDYAVRMQQFFDHFLKGSPAPEWMVKGIAFVDREEEKERFLKAAYDR